MCGRFTLQTTGAQLAGYFLDASLDIAFPHLRPRYNVAPTQMIAAIRNNPDGAAEYASLKWGLVPSWAKDPKIGYNMINARSETLSEKPSFRAALKRRRCLVPLDGFYEWMTDGKQKRPFYIRRPDQSPFVVAGLWEHWTQGHQVIESTTLITTAANGWMRDLHDRMPVIVAPADFEIWLGRPNEDSLTSAEERDRLFKPVADDFFIRHEVAPLVNSPKNETPECIEPFTGFLF